ncbi:MAG: ABC transporter substrate-binding protein [Oscillospiraceae bacterium]|nr:ABC transporter substrate-binding protein [Oscillospiraceae bacterium]
MKKAILTLALAAMMILALAACGGTQPVVVSPGSPPAAGQPAETGAQPTAAYDEEEYEEEYVPEGPVYVTITDFNDNVVQVRQNPTTVAIYDQGILDMLYSVGFERTGIERLIVPSPDTMPDVLSWFRDDGGEVTIVNGGTLFYVDWDVLDLMVPELVILGARSFGMNAAGDRLAAEDVDQFRADTEARYSETSFIRLTINARNSDLLNDMRNNAYALAQIFPAIGDDLMEEIASIEREMAAIAEATSNSGLSTVFVMMTTPTTFSVFLENSRFDMMYEEFGFIPLEMDLELWTDQHGFDAQSEFLLEQNPDVIFLLDRTEPATGLGAATENFMNDPIIARTSAAVNGHIYSGLPMAEWYTVVGGIQSAWRMIEDVNRFVSSIS